MSWKDAKEYCKNRSATLAKINSDFPDDAEILLKEELVKDRRFCVWIGASNVEGNWEWIDGSPTSGVKWDFSVADLNRKSFKCGRFCLGFDFSDAMVWEPGSCDVQFCSICQYSRASVEDTPPPTTTTTKRLRSTARPVRRSRRQRKRKKVNHPVIRKSTGSKIIGTPLFRKRLPAVTMCARACAANSECGIFNHRSSNGYCIGFSRETELMFTDHPEWDRWE